MNKLLFLAVLLGVLASCGKANSSSKRAEVIPSNMPDYICFAIIDDNERVAGGSCVKK